MFVTACSLLCGELLIRLFFGWQNTSTRVVFTNYTVGHGAVSKRQYAHCDSRSVGLSTSLPDEGPWKSWWEQQSWKKYSDSLLAWKLQCHSRNLLQTRFKFMSCVFEVKWWWTQCGTYMSVQTLQTWCSLHQTGGSDRAASVHCNSSYYYYCVRTYFIMISHVVKIFLSESFIKVKMSIIYSNIMWVKSLRSIKSFSLP